MDFVNAVVVHKAFGEGVVVSVNGGYITAKFKVGEKTLQFPWAFEKGFMKFQNEDLQKEVVAVAGNQKAEAEKKAAEEEEKKKAAEEEKKKKIQMQFGVTSAVPGTGTMKYTRRKLINAIAAGKVFTYYPFFGENEMFSNLHPWNFTLDGVTYHTTEQYMMSQKALLFHDYAIYQQILQEQDPKACKKLGRAVRNYDDATWNAHAYGVVLEGCKAKFSQNPELAKALLDTGDAVLVEAAPRDTKWGVGYGKNNELIKDPSQWRGTNYLGFVLMEVRDYLRENS